MNKPLTKDKVHFDKIFPGCHSIFVRDFFSAIKGLKEDIRKDYKEIGNLKIIEYGILIDKWFPIAKQQLKGKE